MDRYAFYSHLPPEAFLEELSHRAEEETADLAQWQTQPGENAQWKAEWKWTCRGDRFGLSCTRWDKGKTGWGAYSERSASAGKGRLSLGTSFGYGKRMFWSKQWGAPFQGWASPCSGGSVLYGKFRVPWSDRLWLLVSLLALLICVVYNRGDLFQVGLGAVFGGTLLVRYFMGLRDLEERPLNQETLAFLKHYSDHWEIVPPDR